MSVVVSVYMSSLDELRSVRFHVRDRVYDHVSCDVRVCGRVRVRAPLSVAVSMSVSVTVSVAEFVAVSISSVHDPFRFSVSVWI